jgi:hypothetical protein
MSRSGKFDISNEWDPAKLKTLMANAKRLGDNETYIQAFRQLCRVQGRNYDDPLDRDFHEVMAALEQALTDARGKTTRLNRTRQKLQRVDVQTLINDLATSKTPSQGFLHLLEFGMGDMSAEYLVLKYSDRFPSTTVAAAKRRLEEFGISLPQSG